MENDDNRGDKKRAREEFENFESEANSVPFLKLSRVDSSEFTRVESDLDDVDVQLPGSKHIQEDLLNFLDDSDPVIGPGVGIQGLDSVLKSFEEEIVVPTQATLPVTSLETGKSKPDLGFLLEASDDELGLPPSFSSVEQGVDIEGSVELGADGIEEMMGYEFPVPSYGSFDFGIGGDSDADNKNHSNSSDFVALGGLLEPVVEISELTSCTTGSVKALDSGTQDVQPWNTADGARTIGDNYGQTLKKISTALGVATLMHVCHDINPPLPQGSKTSTKNQSGVVY